MKQFLLFILLITSLNIAASDQELSLEVSLAKGTIFISETYIGEPVSRRRRLVIDQTCGNKKVEILREQYCDFTDFKIKDKSISFTAMFYNSDTGECSGPKSKKFKIDISECK